MMTMTCHLAAGGPTETPTAFLEWARRAVADARKALSSGRLVAYVWPYREGLGECLSCDVWYDENEHSQNVFAITFVIDGRTDLRDTSEPRVVDMADALHVAGIVLRDLHAGIVLGRPGNGACAAGTALADAAN